MSRLSIVAGIVFVGLICGPAAAQDPSEVVDLYGNGVHAYYAHQDAKAYELLTQVISSGTKDPRAYYFRAMTLMRMGRQAEAIADMQVGATLEAKDAGGAYPVGRSLERVQGRNRRTLEKYRRQARFGALQQRQSAQHLKYENTRRRETDVLRKQVQLGIEDVTPSDSIPPGGVAPQEPAQLPVPDGEGTGDLFQPAAPEGIAPVAPAAPKDAGSTLEEMPDPFGEAPADTGEETPPADSADADPFGEPEAPTAEVTAPAEPATPAEPAMPADDTADVDVGEKVKGKKLIGILGGLLGKTIGNPLGNTAGNAGKLQGPGMGPGPMDPGMGPMPPGMGPGGPADGGQLGPMPGNDPFDEGPATEDASDPFGDDSGDTPDAMPEDTSDPFGDDAPEAMEEENEPADGDDSDPFGETPSDEGPADDPLGGSDDNADDMADDPFGDAPSGDPPAEDPAPADDSVPEDPFDF